MTSSAKPVGRSRNALPWLLLVFIGVLSAVLRYGVVEPSAIVELCESGRGPWWCTARQAIVLGFLNNDFGIAALIAAALALLWKQPWAAWLAAALGAFALEMYCFEAGALALLIGCLRLLRIQAQLLPRLSPAE
ncbi:hypothetical protein [Rhodanobacter sp. BL-MT-08]